MSENAALGPFRVQPRLDAKPWGGRHLAAYGLPLPNGERIGEALITAGESVVLDGPHQGETLGRLVADQPLAVCGERGLAVTGGRPLFPLLIKLIDASANLSIQVHPDDVAAAPDGNKLGKTEAWHILRAEPDAVLYLGLRLGVNRDAFAAASRQGELTAPLLEEIPARRGMTVLTPAGTVHALGAGIVLYEIQQPSDLTYRLDDWGRLDEMGRSRPLHVAQGLAVLRPEQRPRPIPPVNLRHEGVRRDLLVACRYFAVERIELADGGRLTLAADGSVQVITVLRGELITPLASGQIAVPAGRSLVVPASASPSHLAAKTATALLRAWVPDLYQDIVVPARAAGADDAAVRRLAGITHDLDSALA